MGKIGLIIAREYITRVRKKSFVVMTVLGPLLIAGFMSLAIYIGMTDTKKYEVLIAEDSGANVHGGDAFLKGLLTGDDNVSFHFSNGAMSPKQLDTSPYDILINVDPEQLLNQSSKPDKPLKVQMYYKEAPSIQVLSHIQSQLQNASEKLKIQLNDKITPKDYYSIKTYVKLQQFDIKNVEQETFTKELALIGFVFALMIYMFIFLYGAQVMRGVIEEKNSRIVEVIISSVKPFQLMMGKIVGIALVGLTQYLVWVLLTGATFVAIQSFYLPDLTDAAVYQMENQEQMSVGMSELANQGQMTPQELMAANPMVDFIFNQIPYGMLIGMFIFYFIGGYLLYAALFAAIGSAVDSEADTQQFMIPITIPLVFGFIIAQFSISNPGGAGAFWASIVPLTSPVVMMVRVAMGFESADMWQLILSMVLLVVGFVFTTWIAGKIYRVGILMHGKKASYKELAKWIFYKN